MRKSMVLALAVASVTALAACDGALYYRPVSFGLMPIEAAWTQGFAGKTGLIEMHNGPSQAAQQTLLAATPTPPTAAMAKGFTNDPANADDPRYRIVMVFDAPTLMDGADACALAGPKGTGTSATVTRGGTGEIEAALCAGADRVSEIRVRPQGAEILGAGNARQDHKIMADIVRYLYRPSNEHLNDGNCANALTC